MSAVQNVCVAPNSSNNIEIDNNTISTVVVVAGTSKFTTVNIVPNTYLSAGYIIPSMTSGTSYTALTISNLSAGMYQLSYDASFTGTSFGLTDVIDAYWSGSVNSGLYGAQDVITLPAYSYSSARSVGSIQATQNIQVPSTQNLILNIRFTGTATGVSVTLFPFVSCFKIG
jgi:hypothetical protein